MAQLGPGDSLGPFPYRVVRMLSRGGSSEIYLARAVVNGDDERSYQVVIKLQRTDDEYKEYYYDHLSNEVERLRRLKHPRIVRLFPIQKEGLTNLPYIAQSALEGEPWFSVMEYLGGGSLGTLLKGRSDYNLTFALEVAREMAAALDYMHHRGQVHMDIKPENILFRNPHPAGYPPEPVLVDFGVARDVGQKELKGVTWKWTAPELIGAAQGGNRPPEAIPAPHPAMDVYALGLVLYEMITGQFPFKGRTRSGLTTSILNSEPTPPTELNPEISETLAALTLRAIAKDPGSRPSAVELAIGLEEEMARSGTLVYPVLLPDKDGRRGGAAGLFDRLTGMNNIVVTGLIGLVLLQLVFISATRPYWAPLVSGSGGSVPTAVSRVTRIAAPPVATPTRRPSATIRIVTATSATTAGGPPQLTPTTRTTAVAGAAASGTAAATSTAVPERTPSATVTVTASSTPSAAGPLPTQPPAPTGLLVPPTATARATASSTPSAVPSLPPTATTPPSPVPPQPTVPPTAPPAPTGTTQPPTAIPPSSTPVPPTATSVPPSATAAPSATPIPPTVTPPPTATPVTPLPTVAPTTSASDQ